MIWGAENMNYKGRQEKPGIVQYREGLGEDIQTVMKYLQGERFKLFFISTVNREWSSGFKLYHRRLDIGKKCNHKASLD